ncbi:sensor histidine kinase [Myroides sp. LJL115]
MKNKVSKLNGYVICIGSILFISAIAFMFKNVVHYQITALILFLAVSILAILYDILPVTIAAILSAVILNVFFIDPILHYKINSPENVLLFFMFLLVAVLNAVFTNRIKQQERKIRDKEEKEKTIVLYNTLLSSLSHELRTPISTIIGGIDTLRAKDTLVELYKEQLLEQMDLAATRLNQQVGNLLNMNRLETGNLAIRQDWSDINELLFLSIEKFSYAQNNIEFEPSDDLPLCKVDPGLLSQVVEILLHNAIIYNPQSKIRISAQIKNDFLSLSISDFGKGIPPELHHKIFDKFYRLPNEKTGGTGLGLSIAKGFVQAHKGSITLEQNWPSGNTFTIVIPCEVSYLNHLKHE